MMPVLGVPSAEEWMDEAMCDPETWEQRGEDGQVLLCWQCPVRVECLEFADRTEKHIGVSGLYEVFGGETPMTRFRRRAQETLRDGVPGVCVVHGAHTDFYRHSRSSPQCRPCRNLRAKAKYHAKKALEAQK